MDDLRSLHGCLLILHRNITSMQGLVDQHFPCAMRAIEQHKHLLDLIREVAVSGVEIESRQYVTVQISPETWAKIQEVARG